MRSSIFVMAARASSKSFFSWGPLSCGSLELKSSTFSGFVLSILDVGASIGDGIGIPPKMCASSSLAALISSSTEESFDEDEEFR
eukprot:CAMPEP_0167775296 /NCGR_PEP_ID=MMETSP0111_2-20121227/2477_1 /TAXON_ID=91324 /ORGANISM="Lotharella globosa, Strain CCCM811" /LENGTH=84 /DNA_ID=CAMNT_0007665189 /DNA_START=238 /DNA_END=488 /DNA_ORIENTATION=-